MSTDAGRPIWFLDIDGVINALDPRPGLLATTAETAGREWPIHYSPEVVDFINLCHRSGVVEVRWLTTWEQDAHRSLAPAVGLDAFPAYNIPDEDSPSDWWKADIVARVRAEEGRPFIWTDDDLTSAEVSDPAYSCNLLIAPLTETGLTSDHLRAVSDFLVHSQQDHVRAVHHDSQAERDLCASAQREGEPWARRGRSIGCTSSSSNWKRQRNPGRWVWSTSGRHR